MATGAGSSLIPVNSGPSRDKAIGFALSSSTAALSPRRYGFYLVSGALWPRAGRSPLGPIAALRQGVRGAAHGGTAGFASRRDRRVAVMASLPGALQRCLLARAGGHDEAWRSRLCRAPTAICWSRWARGAFRADLYYRIMLHRGYLLPPLRRLPGRPRWCFDCPLPT
jgi:hypothetical protein